MSFASLASAAPPPPPRQANLDSLQSYIRGLNEGRAELYAASLSDHLLVIVDGKPVAQSKAEWLKTQLASFANGYNSYVTVESADFGASMSASGSFEDRTILVERIERVLGDCCVYRRVETLTFRDGLISRIDRSPELNLQLRPDGHRTDGLG